MVVRRYDPPARRDRDQRSKAASTAWISGAYPPRGEDHGTGEAPGSAHTARPWRIHALTRDFRLEDVWALPTPGGPGDSPGWCGSSRPAGRRRATRAPRGRCGRSGGRPGSCSAGTDRTAAAGRGRRRSATGCPPICATRPRGPDFDAAPFTSVYLLEDEWAAEIVNRTVHGVMHIGWVRGRDAAATAARWPCWSKPNGRLGAAYMAAIRPFRHLIVYPPLMRQIGREWQAGGRPDRGVTAGAGRRVSRARRRRSSRRPWRSSGCRRPPPAPPRSPGPPAARPCPRT